MPTSAPLPVRILHTADLQLGMPFRWAEGDAGATLREARLEVLSRIGDLAREERVDVVVVAGDFFDANTVDERTVASACARIRAANVPFVVLPGNHDFCAGPDSIYRRPDFVRAKPENLILLNEREPCVLLEGRLVVLPAPLMKRHSVEDPTAHITAGFGADVAPNAVRLGLAHGDVVGFTRDVDGRARNHIAAQRATLGNLDYLALGDWHGLKQIDERTWYSGAPEPTGFKENDPGHVLIVTFSTPGGSPHVEPRQVAKTSFMSLRWELNTDEDVASLEAAIAAIVRPRDTVLKLELVGQLGVAERERVEKLLQRVAGETLHIRAKCEELGESFTIEELVDQVPIGFPKVVATRLFDDVRRGGEEGRRASLALKILRRTAAQVGGV